jgi:hypothetical protein
MKINFLIVRLRTTHKVVGETETIESATATRNQLQAVHPDDHFSIWEFNQ